MRVSEIESGDEGLSIVTYSSDEFALATEGQERSQHGGGDKLSRVSESSTGSTSPVAQPVLHSHRRRAL